MLVYVITIALVVANAALAQYIKDNTIVYPPSAKRPLIFFFMAIVFLAMVLPASLRDRVGTDYAAYVTMFEHPEWFHSPAYGLFIEIVKFFGSITNNYRIIFVVSSVFIYGLIIFCTYLDSDDIAFSLLLFFIMEDYFVSFNVVRQYWAISLIIVGIVLYANRKRKMFLVCVFAAAIVFHPASLIVLLIPLLCTITFSKRKSIIIGIVTPIITIALSSLLKRVIIAYTPYGRYFSTGYGASTFSVAVELLAIYVFIYITVIMFCSESSFHEDIRIKLFLSATLINIGVMGLSFTFTENTYRLSYFFNPIIALYFPRVVNRIDIRKNRLIIKTGVIVLFSIWTYLLITHHNQNVLPYQSILSNKKFY